MKPPQSFRFSTTATSRHAEIRLASDPLGIYFPQMSRTRQAIDEGAVTASHLSSVETTWETYRDAWVAFARLRYPAAVAVIRAEITLDRYRLLKTI